MKTKVSLKYFVNDCSQIDQAVDLFCYTRFFLYKQHFYKQRQPEIGQKSSKCLATP